MRDGGCTAFLQWALPRRRLRWEGYRKVRAQVCKRLCRRCDALGLPDLDAYRGYLESHPAEWAAFDRLCPITLSRFYRDPPVFDFLASTVLPELGAAARRADERTLRAWSVGCASGEEPYTLRLIWQLAVAPKMPEPALRIVATDVVEAVLARARAACYSAGSLALLPAAWRARAFEQREKEFCLTARFREGVDFRLQDIRAELSAERFSLILCRNLAFTYFDDALQAETLARVLSRLLPGGALAIGRRERLPAGDFPLAPWPGAERLGIFRRSEREVVRLGV
jgi:chemotaxis protein methyltransferase CheR